jgi:hypothetical protein
MALRQRSLAAAALAAVFAFASPAGAQAPAGSSGAPPVAPAGEEAATRPADPEASSAAPAKKSPSYTDRQVLDRKAVRLDKQDRNVVRSGPGDRYSIVGVYPKGKTFSVIAKSGDWYNIRLSDTETGWVHASLCKEFDDLSDLEFKPNPKLYSRVGTFVLTATVGGYSFDRKSNSLALGGRVGYYLLSFLQVEGGVTWTKITRPLETVESLFGLRLEEEQFHTLFYDLDLTVEILPGRQMVPYVSGGVGSTIMQGNSEPTVNFGIGTMLYVGRKTAMRWELRNYRFTSGEDASRNTNSNYEFLIGTSFLM